MINAPGFDKALNIGPRNVEIARAALKKARLKFGAEAIGGNTGRTVKLYIASGRVTVRTLGFEEKVLNGKRCSNLKFMGEKRII